MTESEWLIKTEREEMLRWLTQRISGRRGRLFGVACARHIWPLIGNEASRRAVEVTERFVEGWAASAQLAAAWQAADRTSYGRGLRNRDAAFVASLTAAPAVQCEAVRDGRPIWNAEAVRQGHVDIGGVFRHARTAGGDEGTLLALARDCFSNAVRGFEVEPSWRTTNVLLLAQGIYDERAFDRMPILADALQDAGCGYDNILNHCREPGEHVRGCWVVDLVLGKE